MAPDLKEARRCMATINSVSLSFPLCSVSAKFHIRTRTSLGSFARSNIVLAIEPVIISLIDLDRVLFYHQACHVEHRTRRKEKHICWHFLGKDVGRE